MRLN